MLELTVIEAVVCGLGLSVAIVVETFRRRLNHNHLEAHPILEDPNSLKRLLNAASNIGLICIVDANGDINDDDHLQSGINYVVANSEIHDRAPDLPYLITVTLTSPQRACSSGWFDEKKRKKFSSSHKSFYSDNAKDMNSNTKNKETIFHPTISQIMPRFYLGMNIGHKLSY
ncbi:hypothetical protein LXL04_004928 [Taraxacum kok-saghyz]